MKKKNVVLIILLFVVSIFLFPSALRADGLVPCNGPDCTICSFFQLLANIYNFIVWDIAGPLAVIGVTIGAIFMMASAGNPGIMSTGKRILYGSIIGLVLVFASWLIINTILHTLGYSQDWTRLVVGC